MRSGCLHGYSGLWQCSLHSTHHALLLGSTCPMSLPGHMSDQQHASSPGFTPPGAISWTCRSHYFLMHMYHITSNTTCQICKSHVTFRIPHLPSYPESAGHMLSHGSIHAQSFPRITMSHAVSQVIIPHCILNPHMSSNLLHPHIPCSLPGWSSSAAHKEASCPSPSRCCVSIKEQLGIEGPTLGTWPYHPQSETF